MEKNLLFLTSLKADFINIHGDCFDFKLRSGTTFNVGVSRNAFLPNLILSLIKRCRKTNLIYYLMRNKLTIITKNKFVIKLLIKRMKELYIQSFVSMILRGFENRKGQCPDNAYVKFIGSETSFAIFDETSV